jgi:hypothetical protein
METEIEDADKGESRLVVAIHAYTDSPASLRDVVKVVNDKWPKAKVHHPKLPLQMFSLHRPEQVAQHVAEEID